MISLINKIVIVRSVGGSKLTFRISELCRSIKSFILLYVVYMKCLLSKYWITQYQVHEKIVGNFREKFNVDVK